MLDVLEHLLQPQELLVELSEWALKHGEPLLVVSVPNVSHFDVAFRLLCGRWIPTETGLLDSTHIRFFTAQTLAHLFERTGWEVVAEDNFSAVRGDQYDARLTDSLPLETGGRAPGPVRRRKPARRGAAVRLGGADRCPSSSGPSRTSTPSG